MSGLSCSTSLVALRRVGSQFPHQGSNPHPLHGKEGSLFIFIYLFLAVLSLHSCSRAALCSCSAPASHCSGFFCGARAGGHRDSANSPPRLSSTGSVVTHGLSCSAAYGIFPNQGLTVCLLHWQMDSLYHWTTVEAPEDRFLTIELTRGVPKQKPKILYFFKVPSLLVFCF